MIKHKQKQSSPVCLHYSSCSGEPRLRSLQIVALLCDETRIHVGALVTHTGDYVWRKEGKISFNVITMMKNADEIVRTQKKKLASDSVESLVVKTLSS